jgi:hypothetical protein
MHGDRLIFARHLAAIAVAVVFPFSYAQSAPSIEERIGTLLPPAYYCTESFDQVKQRMDPFLKKPMNEVKAFHFSSHCDEFPIKKNGEKYSGSNHIFHFSARKIVTPRSQYIPKISGRVPLLSEKTIQRYAGEVFSVPVNVKRLEILDAGHDALAAYYEILVEWEFNGLPAVTVLIYCALTLIDQNTVAICSSIKWNSSVKIWFDITCINSSVLGEIVFCRRCHKEDSAVKKNENSPARLAKKLET